METNPSKKIHILGSVQTADKTEREFTGDRNVDAQERSAEYTTNHNETKSKRKSPIVLQILSIVGPPSIIFVLYAVKFGMNVIYVEIIRKFNVSRTHASLLYTISGIAGVVSVLIGNVIIRKFGIGFCLILWGVTCSIGCLCAAFSNNANLFSISFGTLIGSGGSILTLGAYIAPVYILSSEKKQRLLTIALTVSSGISHACGSIILETLFETLGSTATFILIAGLFLQTCVPSMAVWAVARGRKSKEEARDPGSWRQDTKALLKNKTFVLYMATDFMRLCFQLSYGNIQVDHSVTLGFDVETGAFIAFLFGVSALVGRVINGIVLHVKRWHTIYHYSLLGLMLSVGMFVMTFVESYSQLIAANCFLGLFGGALSDFVYIFLHEILKTPGTYALGTTAHVFVSLMSMAALSPMAGWIRDMTGSYNPFLFSALPISGLASVLFAGHHLCRTYRNRKSVTLRCDTTAKVTPVM